MARLRLHQTEVDLFADADAAEFLDYFDAEGDVGLPPALTIRLLPTTRQHDRPAGRHILVQGFVRMYSDDGWIWLHDGWSTLSVSPDGGLIEGSVHRGSMENRHRFVHHLLFFGLLVAMCHQGLFHAHAGAVLHPTGRGMLILGEAGAGKTTATMSLTSAGWRFLGDDAVWLTRDEGILVLAIRRPFHLGGQTARMFGETTPHTFETPDLEGKIGLDPREAFPGGWVRALRSPAVLLFPSVSPALARTRVSEMDDATALEGLIRSSTWFLADDMPGRREHFALLQDLYRSALSLSVELGADLFDEPTLLSRLLQPYVGLVG